MDAGGKLGFTTYCYVVLLGFGIVFGFGIEFTCTWNEIILFALGFFGWIAYHIAVFALGVVVPFVG